jgi:hypothetical protein
VAAALQLPGGVVPLEECEAHMTHRHKVDESPTDSDRRAVGLPSQRGIAGFPGREKDIEPTKGLHAVAILFRILSGLMVLLMAIQVANGLASTVEISYGVLFAEAIRLAIFAGVLWGAGDLVDLFVKSHYDLRATRILIARLTHLVEQAQAPDSAHPGEAGPGRGDALH